MENNTIKYPDGGIYKGDILNKKREDYGLYTN